LRVLKNTQFCLAEQQTAGRGRLGRDWFSPFAENIYMSCLHPFNKDLSELAGLSLVVSLAVMRALQQFGVAEEVHVKWPNDILCEGKKISGILIDVQAESHGACHAIIGIGVNVNMRHDDAVKITQPWTSMREAGGEYVDRNKAAAALMNHLQDYLQRFEKEGFAAFIKEWEEAEGMSGKMISVKTQQETIRGQAAGINAQGHLLVKLQDGTVRAFSSGDTTVLK
jgi:BirA family biotin operon repressor/biotin-[acetyl-CoA-carboxylase] ligase